MAVVPVPSVAIEPLGPDAPTRGIQRVEYPFEYRYPNGLGRGRRF